MKKRDLKKFNSFNLIYIIIILLILLSILIILKEKPFESPETLPLTELKYIEQGSTTWLTTNMKLQIIASTTRTSPGLTEYPVKLTFRALLSNGKIDFDEPPIIYEDFLYNDGLHVDKEPFDSWLGNNIDINQIPELQTEKEYLILISLCPNGGCPGVPDSWNIQTKEIKLLDIINNGNECEEFIPGTNDPTDTSRLNLIIWGLNIGNSDGNTFLPNWEHFFRLANSQLYIDQGTHPLGYYSAGELNHPKSFFNRQPAKEYKSNFNFWYINPMYNGAIKSGDDKLYFMEEMIKRCPYNNAYLIIYEKGCCSEYSYSCEAGGVINCGIDYDPLQTAGPMSHELGHHIAKLGDEYGTCTPIPDSRPEGRMVKPNSYYASDLTNTKELCEENADWRHLVGSCLYMDSEGTEHLEFESCNSPNRLLGQIFEEVSCQPIGNLVHATLPDFRCDNEPNYRWVPAPRTNMRTPGLFSTVDISAFCREFEKYTGQRKGICSSLCLDGCPAQFECNSICPNGETCITNPDGSICTSSNPCLADTDGDSICDSIDNCPDNPNPDQLNSDNDNLGDACDLDNDNDLDPDLSDCAPFNPLIHNSANEICTDFIDNDCDGLSDSNDPDCIPCIDLDGDGFGQNCPLGTESQECEQNLDSEVNCPLYPIDCTPETNTCGICRNPEKTEICDNLDNNCNSQIDEICDLDLDGFCDLNLEFTESNICFGFELTECDNNPSRNPGIFENLGTICSDGIDNNCDKVADYCNCIISNARWSKTIINEGEKVNLDFDIPYSECLNLQSYEFSIYTSGFSDYINLETELGGTFIELPQFRGFPEYSPEFNFDCSESENKCKAITYYFKVKRYLDNMPSIQSNYLYIKSPQCDADGDTYLSPGCSNFIAQTYPNTEFDCNDLDASINHASSEICSDGIDNNCNGLIDCAEGSCSGDPSCIQDTDSDGIPDSTDNCINTPNPTQSDFDSDGIGDACDPQTCGNNVQEGTEQCDGTDLAGESCVSRGFDIGTLACSSCAFDTAQCSIFPCSLTSAFWSTTNAVEGQQVNLVLNGNNCAGKTIDFAVIELDVVNPNDPANINPGSVAFVGNSVSVPWIAEWQCDGDVAGVCTFGNPEYFFVADVRGEAESISSELLPNGLLTTTAQSPSCGNGILEGTEECDSGNQNSDTGACTTLCTTAICNDGFIYQGVEQCDSNAQACSQNSYSGMQSCLNDCSGFDSCILTESCGDRIINGLEVCDSGALNGLPNECNSQCSGITNPNCGNSIIEAGEQCDDGNALNTDACDACQLTICGDGVIQNLNGNGVAETCDSGALNGLPNECNSQCSGITNPNCGNSVIEAGEQCDDGNANNNDACTNSCLTAICGDAIVYTSVEECDSGVPTSQCTSLCELTFCGDGIVQSPNGQGELEVCDLNSQECSQNGYSGTTSCSGTCLNYGLCILTESCGDGIIQVTAGEECDDNNNLDNDGCNALCMIEVQNQPPTLNVINPMSITYKNVPVPLSIVTANADKCWYVLDSVRTDIACDFAGFLVIQGARDIPENHTIIVFANNSDGIVNESIEFTILRTRIFNIQYNKFKGKGMTTDLDSLNDSDLGNVSLKLDNGLHGRIEFLDRVNLTRDSIDNVTDIDSNVNISDRRIEIKGSNLQGLNKKARLIFYNIGFTNYVIKIDGSDCLACKIISYDSNTKQLVVEVQGFSVYTIEQAPPPPGDTGGGSSGGGGGSGSRGGGGSVVTPPNTDSATKAIKLPELPDTKEIDFTKETRIIKLTETKVITAFNKEEIILEILQSDSIPIKIEILNNKVFLTIQETEYTLSKIDTKKIEIGKNIVYIQINSIEGNNINLIIGLDEMQVKEIANQMSKRTYNNTLNAFIAIISIILILVLIIIYRFKK